MRGLRIGLVCPYSFEAAGGVQSHVLGLARHLLEAGHDPRVLAPGELGEAAAELIGVDRFTSAGAAVPVRYNGSVARVNFGPVSAGRVARWLQHHRFDLLHLHEPITPSISLLTLRAATVPVVATFHTATPRSRSMQVAGGVLRRVIGKIGAGIAVSESARNVVVQHLGRDAVVIPNGFRFADFATPARPASWPLPRLVALGRVDEPRKGIDVLLAAVPAIQDAVGPVEAVIAGRGSRPLPPWCTSLGAVTDREKVALLQSADVFVAPHLERESFGIVLVEAMASATPVVASALPAFADVLGGGVQSPLGRLFRVGDPADLARAVVDTLRRPDAHRVEQAQRVARRYDWRVVGPEVEGVYGVALAAAERFGGGGRFGHSTRPRSTWAALDAALVGRAQRAADLAGAPDTDPTVAIRISHAAAAALAPGLNWHQRERAESDLSHALAALASASCDRLDPLRAAHARSEISRRLHNDAVAFARRRKGGSRLRAAGVGAEPVSFEPKPFEMADLRELRWPRDR